MLCLHGLERSGLWSGIPSPPSILPLLCLCVSASYPYFSKLAHRHIQTWFCYQETSKEMRRLACKYLSGVSWQLLTHSAGGKKPSFVFFLVQPTCDLMLALILLKRLSPCVNGGSGNNWCGASSSIYLLAWMMICWMIFFFFFLDWKLEKQLSSSAHCQLISITHPKPGVFFHQDSCLTVAKFIISRSEVAFFKFQNQDALCYKSGICIYEKPVFLSLCS